MDKQGYIPTVYIYKRISEINEQIKWQNMYGNVATREKLAYERWILEELLNEYEI